MAQIEVQSLSVGYGSPLLQDICFCASAGEILGILGRNGSGKTTLLRGLAGNARRFAGGVWVDGRNCTAMKPKEQAAYLAVLPQHTDVLEGILVRELLEMGRYPYGTLFREDHADTSARIRRAAQVLGIQDLLDADCGKLSQGQRQMALFARLIVQDAPVMLLDEPNAALDYDNANRMFACLKDWVRREGKTALVVLHDPEQALRWCDRLLVLKDGQIAEDLSAQAGEDRVNRALQQLYPEMRLRRDPYDGHYRCYTK